MAIEQQLIVGEVIERVYNDFDQASLSFGHGTENAWDEAVYLVLSVTGHPDDEASLQLKVSNEDLLRVQDLAHRRTSERAPLAHLLGECQFMGQRFLVQSGVMIPRSPIGYLLGEPLQDWVADDITKIVDLCAGVGCLGILAAQRYPRAQVRLVELEAKAAALARRNIDLHGLADRVSVVEGDACLWLAEQTNKWDLILTNPPYVDAADMRTLPKEYRHEPELGLAAGEDGLSLVDAFLPELPGSLTSKGVFLCEVGASAPAMKRKYPKLPLQWLPLPLGGEGVFLLAAEDQMHRT